MAALLEQLPALIGVLVGAAATYAATSTAERARWRREQSVRWDEKRVNAYSEYGYALKRVISLTVRIAAHRGAHSLGEPLSPEDGLSLLQEAEHERQLKWEAILLLGSNEAVEAARGWHASVFPMEEIARGHRTTADWDGAVKVVSEARGKFYRVARHDLGLPAGDSSEAYDWQFNRAAVASLDTNRPSAPDA